MPNDPSGTIESSDTIQLAKLRDSAVEPVHVFQGVSTYDQCYGGKRPRYAVGEYLLFQSRV